MGHGKRPRDLDEAMPPPRPKQSKIDSFLLNCSRNNKEDSYTVETHNRFNPLIDLVPDIEVEGVNSKATKMLMIMTK
ncbi:Hypothetical predicted protein, partial [Podarcis lilfordi]